MRMESIANSVMVYFETLSPAGSFGHSLEGTINAQPAMVYNGFNIVITGPGFFPTIPLNVFLAISSSGDGSGALASLVMTILDTGKIQAQSFGQPIGASIAGDSIYRIGNGGQGVSLARIAAATIIPSYLDLKTLIQWAESPWSFWYPDV